VRRVALAHGVERLEADLGGGLSPLDVGRDVPLGEVAEGPVELGRGLQAVLHDCPEELAQQLLLPALPLLVLADRVCDAGLFQEVGEDVVGGLEHPVAQPVAAVLHPDEGHGERWVRERRHDHGAELLGFVEGPVIGAESFGEPGLGYGCWHP